MKKIKFWILFVLLPCLLAGLLAGCLSDQPTLAPPEHIVMVITVVVTATPGADIIATAPRISPTPEPSPTVTPTRAPSVTPTPEPSSTPTRSPSNTPFSQSRRLPTPVPDYSPGGGMAVLTGNSPYELSILPGGWQAYRIGPSSNQWGYLVDINPHGPAPSGAYIESKILPEVSAGEWVDVLWLRAPGIKASLPVTVDLIPTRGWDVTFETNTRLTPGEWTGWGMFDNAEGCGGVLDISPEDGNQTNGVSITDFRVQPEFPGNWVQVIRVSLATKANAQNTWLRYYAPGSQGVEVLRKKATLSPGKWNGFVVGPSYIRQGYLVEVMPQKKVDNAVDFAVVRPESDGEVWRDVLRVHVPEGRPPLEALLRVLAVKVVGQ